MTKTRGVMRMVKKGGKLGLSLTPGSKPEKKVQPRVVIFEDGTEAPVRRQDSRWKVESEQHGWFSAVTLARLQKDLSAFTPGAKIVIRKRKKS